MVEEDPDFDEVEDNGPSRGAGALPPPGYNPSSPGVSPDDPRYGRPRPPAYSERGPGFIYPDDRRAPPPAMPQAGNGAPDALRPPGSVGSAPAAAPPAGTAPAALSILPPEDQPETGAPKELPSHLRKQEVDFPTREPAGTIVIDTANTHLYYILGGGRAIRYGIRVGRDGFRWAGMQKVTKKTEWPDWHPPTEMIERQPYLPRFMAGGPGNPLGARALYLGNTVYRIHGTNQPSTIGKRVSSGCFGLLNDDVSDLYERVKVGTRVVVLPGGTGPETVSAAPAPGAATGVAQGGGPQSLAPPQGIPQQGPPQQGPQGGPYVSAPGATAVGGGSSGGPITSAPLPPPTLR
jgi:lipoprotein-anchoring transpeptidase ErfK/SrfK